MKKWKLAREPCEKNDTSPIYEKNQRLAREPYEKNDTSPTKKWGDLQESPMKKMTLALPKNGVTCKRAL